jgi:hypothetical protein
MRETLWIRDTVWNKIRNQFTEKEKAEMREHMCGETICPRGLSVDLAGLTSAELADKLATAVEAANKRRP